MEIAKPPPPVSRIRIYLACATPISAKSNGSEKVVGPTAVKENMNPQWAVVPNPSYGIFTVAGNGHAIESIRIFNALGEQIYYKNVIAKKAEVALPEIAKGIYHLQIISEGAMINKKIVIK